MKSNLSVEAECGAEPGEVVEDAADAKKTENGAENETPAATNPAKNRLQLTCDIDDVLTYAAIHNGAHVIRDICVKNISESDLDNLMIRVSSSNNLTENFELGIEKIKPGEELHFKNLNVLVNAGYLASLTERHMSDDGRMKKVSVRMSKQGGVKFCWRKDQDPDLYIVYRDDGNCDDKRSVDEICQQELKNAVCITLKEQGPLNKDSLLKAAIRTMGYARSSTALLAAAERGLKYGRKTGEIVLDEEKRFALKD